MKASDIMLLSVAMIVKNEENNIRKSLEALKKLDGKIEYEIIIIDTGSIDNTINIAKEYTDKVYEHMWNEHFAEMRNRSISYCGGKWILILDADEVLENADDLVAFLKDSKNEKYNAATIIFKNMISDNENDYVIGTLGRLFKKRKEFYYEGRVHEQPKFLPPLCYTNISLLHYGYSRQDYKVMQYKYERNRDLLLKELKNGKDLVYTYFQLAQTYSMANKYNESSNYIKKSYNLIKDRQDKNNYLYVYHFYANEELRKCNYEKVIELCEIALKYTMEHLDFYFMISKSYYAIKEYKKAGEYCQKYLKLREKIEDGYIVKDISVVNYSFSQKDAILSEKIVCDFNQKKYIDIPNIFSQISSEIYKKQLVEVYLYSLIKKKEYNKIFEYYNNEEISDSDIQLIINVLKKLEELDDDIFKQIKTIDIRLEKYIETIYENKISDYDGEIEVNGYYDWKSEYINKLFSSNKIDLNILNCIFYEDMKLYIMSMNNDYKCIARLYDYSVKFFLNNNISTLTLINHIEDVLLINDSINNEEYEKLIVRSYVNKMNYLNMIYNVDIIKDEKIWNIMRKNEKMWLELDYLIAICNENPLDYIRGIRKMIGLYPEYKRLIKVFLQKVPDCNISKEMVKEKDKILNQVEEMIFNNRKDEALNILRELNAVFSVDWRIFSCFGIVHYLNSDYEKSILYLSMSHLLNNNNFEIVYNMACVLVELKNSACAEEYYKKAYELCEDEEVKKSILTILDNIVV